MLFMNIDELNYLGDGAWNRFEDDRAFAYFSLSAEKGDAYGAFRLAECYDYGRGVCVSKSRAAELYRISCEKGYEPAREHSDWLSSHPEFVRMVDGEPYSPLDEEIGRMQRECRTHLAEFNASFDQNILHSLLHMREGAYVEAPLLCDFGENIHMGYHSYMGMNCLVLDSAPVYIGANVSIGAGVQIYTPSHPLDAEERSRGLIIAKPVIIEDDVRIAPGAIICPGVTIGKGAIITEGAVVHRSVPAGCRALGNPAQIESLN